MRNVLLASLFALLIPRITYAQDKDAKALADSILNVDPEPSNIFEKMLAKGFAVIPVAFYSPETKFGGGIGGFYYFRLAEDTITRPSSVNLAAIYTQNRQIIFQVPFQLSTKENKHLISGEVGYYKYPFKFYGIGNDIDLDVSEGYEPNIVRIKGTFYRRLKPKTFIGPRIRYEYQNMQGFEMGGKLATEDILGTKGGHVLGLGLSFLIDKRNNIFTPNKGYYFNFSSYGTSEDLGSDYTMGEFLLDGRKYFPLGKHTIASQLYVQHQRGDVPFFMLAEMGGYYRMRGFFQGAFRDKTFMTAQTEWRFPLFWRLGGAAFGSLGQVSDDLEINKDFIRFAGGLGLRVLFNDQENINLRIDYAMGKNTSGFYLTVSEAF